MSRSATRARPGQDRASLYAEITDKIIAELEAERLPWVQPWGASGTGAAVGLPRNAATGRRYSGINVLILWGAVIERGYSGQAWLTFRQALALGALYAETLRFARALAALLAAPAAPRLVLSPALHRAARTHARATARLDRAEAIIELQKKLADLLGLELPPIPPLIGPSNAA